MASPVSGIGSLSGLMAGAPRPSGGSGIQSTLEMAGQGSNQYTSYPLPIATQNAGSGAGAPGSVPAPPTLPGSAPINNPNNLNYITGAPGSNNEIPNTNSQHLEPTFDPYYTQQYYNMLSQQLGKGLPGFNLQTVLPSSGQTTQAGQLNAPLNNVYQQLQALLTGGSSSIPGASAATSMANTGNPVNQTPAWQAMIASEQQNTAQNANNLREQFASAGDLNSSPFGTAMQQFYNQNAMNQNAQLTQATTAEGDAAANRALSAQQGFQGLAEQTGSNLQTIDQNAINQMLQEFNYTLPQNNPMNQMFQTAALSSPNVAGTPTSAQNFASVAGGIGSLLGSIF